MSMSHTIILSEIMVHASWHRFPLEQWAAHGVTPRHALIKFKKSGTELFVVDGEGIKLKGSKTLFAETWGHWMARMNERRQKDILQRGGKLVNKRGENLKTAMFVSFDSGRSFHMLGNVLLCRGLTATPTGFVQGEPSLRKAPQKSVKI